MAYNTQQQAARRAHMINAIREAEALERKSAFALRMGNEKRANSFASKARQYRARAQQWGG